MAGMSKILTTIDEVIDALDGPKEVAKIVGNDTRPATVRMWRHQGLPSYSFLVLQAALTERGYSAPASLWRVPEPEGWEVQFVKTHEATELSHS